MEVYMCERECKIEDFLMFAINLSVVVIWSEDTKISFLLKYFNSGKSKLGKQFSFPEIGTPYFQGSSQE